MVVDLITRTLEGPPSHTTQWSTRSMAETVRFSKATISRIWQTFGLQTHRVDTFKLSADPQFVEKVRDIVGLYLNPPDHALVLCLDEKSQIQALDRTRPLLPMRPGLPAQQTHDYIRHGTTSLFAALNVATGAVIGECHRRHRHQEFLKFLRRLDAQLPPTGEVHIIMDNYGTHKVPKVIRWFLRHPRYHLHFTPTSASWMNQVERFFAKITTQRIRRGTFENVPALEMAIDEYLTHHNDHCKPFVWTATADAILDKVKRFCQRTSETRH
jgi:transposase